MHVCGDARAWLGLAFSERHRLLVGAERVQYNRASLLYRGTFLLRSFVGSAAMDAAIARAERHIYNVDVRHPPRSDAVGALI